jgi:hypothetical protein
LHIDIGPSDFPGSISQLRAHDVKSQADPVFVVAFRFVEDGVAAVHCFSSAMIPRRIAGNYILLQPDFTVLDILGWVWKWCLISKVEILPVTADLELVLVGLRC